MSMKIWDTTVYEENAKVVDVYGQGSNRPTGKGVDGLDVYFTIEIDGTEYTVVYQTDERTANTQGYSGYEMDRGCRFGLDCDESEEVESLKNGEQHLDELKDIAQKCAKEWVEGRVGA